MTGTLGKNKGGHLYTTFDGVDKAFLRFYTKFADDHARLTQWLFRHRERQRHTRTKSQRKGLAARFKNPADDFRLAIVVDMWLTGFDVPCAHTMYLDKPRPAAREEL